VGVYTKEHYTTNHSWYAFWLKPEKTYRIKQTVIYCIPMSTIRFCMRTDIDTLDKAHD